MIKRCLTALLFSGSLLPSQGTTAQDPATLEHMLLDQPGNDEVRSSLMDAYLKAGDPGGYLQQLMWLIQNQPESHVLATKGKLKPGGGPLNTPGEYEQFKSDWDTQLDRHAEFAPVLYNAAVFLTPSDPSRAIDLLEKARKLMPDQPDYVTAEGAAYLLAFVRDADGNPAPPLTVETANALKARLLRTFTDAELLSSAGKVLADEGHTPGVEKDGLRLMERAARISPNQKFTKALEEVSPDASRNLPRMAATHIASDEAEANLISKVAPSYPPIAKSGRVEGVVMFKVLIDEDGDVTRLDLVSGPQLLVDAARDALLQWQYKPTLVNDKPVAVTTDVSVTFSLSQ